MVSENKYTLRSNAYGKVNLSLRICGQRDDGYHEMHSLFHRIPLYDTVEIQYTLYSNDIWPNYSACYKCSTVFDDSIQHLSSSAPIQLQDNIVIKAAKYFHNAFCARYATISHRITEVAIQLHKRIPVGSGLGGGSSDAATTMIMLNKLYSDVYNTDPITMDYSKVAYNIGADVPFFLHNTRSALVTGVGDVVKPIHSKTINKLTKHMLIVNPNIELLTKDTFTSYVLDTKNKRRKKSTIGKATLGNNDLLQNSAIPDTIPHIISLLKSCDGCRIASMSGSGSTCFALYTSKKYLMAAKHKMQSMFSNYYIYSHSN